MDLQLKGKVALVRPDNAIARAIAARLEAEGCAVKQEDASPDIVVWCGASETRQLKELLEEQLLAPLDLVGKVATAMRRRRSGRVIFVIDEAAKVPGAEVLPAAVCGAAQLALVKSLSDDLGRDGVLVNAVCVSHIEGHPARAVPQPYIGRSLEQQEAQWGNDVPLARRGSLDDIANAVAYLASARASFIVGSNIDVDGGYQRSFI